MSEGLWRLSYSPHPQFKHISNHLPLFDPDK
jgi:hypothetical protein